MGRGRAAHGLLKVKVAMMVRHAGRPTPDMEPVRVTLET